MSASAPAAHRTVLAAPAVDYLITDPGGTYVDATFGRGGHSKLILERLAASGRLIALDRDPQATAAAAELGDRRFHFVHTRFSRLSETLDALGVPTLNGLLLDLGVSSPQIDEGARGFSWRADAPLDMRMVTRVIRDYGEERFAAAIAKAVVARRQAGRPIVSTADLAAVVAGAIPVRSRGDAAQHPATRTFQAVRIHVNQELEELAVVLEQAVSRLAARGRLVVISFHSLEDRLVKRFIDRHAHPERGLPRLPLRAAELPQPRLVGIARVQPDAAEVAVNPRCRSAVMRVAERTTEPVPGAAR